MEPADSRKPSESLNDPEDLPKLMGLIWHQNILHQFIGDECLAIAQDAQVEAKMRLKAAVVLGGLSKTQLRSVQTMVRIAELARGQKAK